MWCESKINQKNIIYLGGNSSAQASFGGFLAAISVNCYLKELNKEKEITWNSKLSLFLMKGESSQ